MNTNWHFIRLHLNICQYYPGIILCMPPANERWHYNIMLSLIGWVHSQNDPWLSLLYKIVTWHKQFTFQTRRECWVTDSFQMTWQCYCYDTYTICPALIPWWRHEIKTLSALLALCAKNLFITDKFSSQMVSNGNICSSFVVSWAMYWKK